MLVFEPLIITGAFIFVRFIVAFVMIPLCADSALPVVPAGGLALVLTFFFVPLHLVPVVSFAAPMFFLILLKEIVVGVLLGAAVRLCWSVLWVAGGLVRLGAMSDTSREDNGVLGLLYLFFGTGAFLLMGGHHAVFSAVGHSLATIPVGIAGDSLGHSSVTDMSTLVFQIFSGAFLFGVLLAAPIFVSGLIVELWFCAAERIFGDGLVLTSVLGRNLLVQGVVVLFLWKSVSLIVAFLGRNVASLS